MKLLIRDSALAVMLTNELFALVRAVASYDSYKTQIGYLPSICAATLYLLQQSIIRAVILFFSSQSVGQDCLCSFAPKLTLWIN